MQRIDGQIIDKGMLTLREGGLKFLREQDFGGATIHPAGGDATPLDFYLVGDAAAGWDAPGCFADPDYRLGSTDEGAKTAVWSGRLNAGELKFCGADRTVDWTHGTWYLAAAGGETIVSGRSYPVVSETLSGSDVASDYKWIVPEAGDYTVVFDWERNLLTVTKR